MRVLGYHQFSTVIYETLLDEVPNLADWIQRKPDGSMATYGGATWRWKACPIHDEFIAYLKRVMDHCLLEAGMDGVEFDGTSYECYCEKCQAAFRQYLAEHNPRPLERFGIPHFRHVRIPPSYDRKDPLWQEWVRFRIDLMGRRLRELRAYTHLRKPGAALVTYVDGPMGWRSDTTRILPDAGDYLDLSVAESHAMPQVLEGELVNKVRYLKEGTAMGRLVLSTDWLRTPKGGIALPEDPKPVELDMAECLACGGHVLTATWSLRSGDKRDGSAFFEQPAFHQALKRYMGFSRDHEDLYAGSLPCANVWGVPLTGFPGLRSHHRIQQRAGLRAGPCWDESPIVSPGRRTCPMLGPRDVLIVANQTCLSREECQAVRAAVGRGCGLILTGRSSACDENFRQHQQPALEDLQSAPRVRYFARCPGVTGQPERTMRSAMPREAGQILRTVKGTGAAGSGRRTRGRRPATALDLRGCLPSGARLRRACRLLRRRRVEGIPAARGRLAGAGQTGALFPRTCLRLCLWPSVNGWIELPASFGRYAAVRFS